MWRENTRRLLCVAMVLSLAVLAGCAPGYDPQREARAAVQDWIDAFNLALSTNDASRLESLSGPDCGMC